MRIQLRCLVLRWSGKLVLCQLPLVSFLSELAHVQAQAVFLISGLILLREDMLVEEVARICLLTYLVLLGLLEEL